MSDIWIDPDGLRVRGKGKPGGAWADGDCPECHVAYNHRHECECGDNGGYAEPQWQPLTAVPVVPPDQPQPTTVGTAFKAWLKRMMRPASNTAVWLAQLATVFWLEIRTLPEKPFEDVLELPDGVPYNYLAAAMICGVFSLWAVLNIKKPK